MSLILSGDQLYRMDYREMLQTARGHQGRRDDCGDPGRSRGSRGTGDHADRRLGPRAGLRGKTADAEEQIQPVLMDPSLDQPARH